MLTIIMPFYKKYKEFTFAFEHFNFKTFNDYPNLELIICADDPYEVNELASYLKNKVSTETTNFSIKVFVNEIPHTWRCPCKAINVGIKQAQYPQCIVLSPETIPLPNSLQTLAQQCDSKQFSIGIIKSLLADEVDHLNPLTNFLNATKAPLPYGSICFKREQAEMVSGYDEDFIEWGGDDDDFRERLIKAGFRKRPTLAKFIHLEFDNRILNKADNLSHQKSKQVILNKLEKIAARKSHVANCGNYGLSFNKVVFAYEPIRIF
jgi:hypothetical protein